MYILQKHIVRTIFLILLNQSSLVIAQDNPIPIESFVNNGDYLDLKISPDGKHFAGRFRQKGSTSLLFIQRSDMKVVGGVNPGKGNVVHTVNWVTNERVVFEYAEKKHYLDAPISTGELFAVDIDGKPDMLYGYRASDKKLNSRISSRKNDRASQDLLSLLEKDEKHVLIIEHPWEQKGKAYYDTRIKNPTISKLNIYSGRKKKIESIPFKGANALATKNGEVNFISWLDDENIQRSAYRTNKKDEWKEISSRFDVSSDVAPVSFDSKKGVVYLYGSYGEEGVDTLFELNVKTGKTTPIFDNGDVNIAAWLIDDTTSRPVVGFSYLDGPKYHYSHDVASNVLGVHKVLAKVFKGQEVTVTSHTKKGDIFLVRVSSDINPGEYYLYNKLTKKADFVWANQSWIDPRTMSPVTRFKFAARDGLELRGFLTLPAALKENEKKPPVVVLIHGGPYSRDYWEFDGEVQLLANRGYAVLQINFRGSAGYGDKFKEMGHREWGGKMIDDIVDATNWVVNEGYVDGERICAFGASYGGYAALMTAIREPNLLKCTVGYAGLYDLNLMYTKGDIKWTDGGQAYLERAIGRDKSVLVENSPVFHVDKINLPVMLIHGKQDLRVPYDHARAMRNALTTAGKKVEWLTYGRAGHGVWNEKDQVELYTEILSFLDKNIGHIN